MGSHTISVRPSDVVVAISSLCLLNRLTGPSLDQRRHVGSKPVLSSRPLVRHFGSSSVVLLVIVRRVRMTFPYRPLAAVEIFEPGGSSMNGMNLSGKPGMVQPMQMPPTLGQPPTPLIQPRFGTLHLTTGPQQPSFTRQRGDPYSVANSPCS